VVGGEPLAQTTDPRLRGQEETMTNKEHKYKMSISGPGFALEVGYTPDNDEHSGNALSGMLIDILDSSSHFFCRPTYALALAVFIVVGGEVENNAPTNAINDATKTFCESARALSVAYEEFDRRARKSEAGQAK